MPRLWSTSMRRWASGSSCELWREACLHFVLDPQGMVGKLEPLKPLVGSKRWHIGWHWPRKGAWTNCSSA